MEMELIILTNEVNFVNMYELCYLSIVFELCPSLLNFVHVMNYVIYVWLNYAIY